MPTGRTRITSDEPISYTNPSGPQTVDTRYRKCEDTINGDFTTPYPLKSKRSQLYTGTIDRLPYWQNVPGFGLGGIGSDGYDFASWTIGEQSSLATQGIARTQISRPHIRLPVTVAEFRELPLLIAASGKRLLRTLAGANLKVNFGILPMAQDVRALLSFTSQVDKKVDELRQVYSKGGLKRTFTRSPLEFSQTQKTGLYSVSFSAVRWDTTPMYTVSEWYSCRYRPHTSQLDSLPQNEEHLRRLAYKYVTGTHWTHTLSNVWELVPWSWLVDWFSNVGDFIEASSGMINYDSTSECVMRHTVRTCAVENVTNSDPSRYRVTSTGSLIEEQKERFPSSGLPTFSIAEPILSVRQLSTLASLLILKSKTRNYLPFLT